MKFWIRLLLLIVFDFIAIWFWVKESAPDPSVSIGLVLLIPFAIALNLLIALIFYTKRQYALLFLANAVPSAIIMYYLFIANVGEHQGAKFEAWSFQVKDTTFRLIHTRLDSSFYMTYSTNPGNSISFMAGKFTDHENSHLLTDGSIEYVIKDGYLFDFRSDSIRLIRDDY